MLFFDKEKNKVHQRCVKKEKNAYVGKEKANKTTKKQNKKKTKNKQKKKKNDTIKGFGIGFICLCTFFCDITWRCC